MSKAWERQKNETAKAYEAFCLYRDMRPGERSQPRLVEEYGVSAKSACDWSRKHDWVQRCEAWDDEQDRIATQAHVQEIAEMRKRHAALASNLLEKAAEALMEIEMDKIRAGDLSKMIETGAKLERISRGDVGDVIEERDGGEAVSAVTFYMPDNQRDGEEP